MLGLLREIEHWTTFIIVIVFLPLPSTGRTPHRSAEESRFLLTCLYAQHAAPHLNPPQIPASINILTFFAMDLSPWSPDLDRCTMYMLLSSEYLLSIKLCVNTAAWTTRNMFRYPRTSQYLDYDPCWWRWALTAAARGHRAPAHVSAPLSPATHQKLIPRRPQWG